MEKIILGYLQPHTSPPKIAVIFYEEREIEKCDNASRTEQKTKIAF